MRCIIGGNSKMIKEKYTQVLLSHQIGNVTARGDTHKLANKKMNSTIEKLNFISALKIMRKLHPILLFFISFLLMGCPMKSEFSLVDKPTLKIDQRLLGVWKFKIDSKQETENYVMETEIIRSTSTEYQLTVTKKSENYDASTLIFRAYLADFADNKWLIVNNEEENTNYFFLIGYLEGNQLGISELGNDMMTDISNKEAFREYVNGHPHYDKNSTWIKQ